MDLMFNLVGVDRSRFYVLNTLFVMVPLLCLLYLPAPPLWIFVFVGLSFGGNYAVLTATLAGWYGRSNVALSYAIASCLYVFGVKVMSYAVSSEYDRKTEEGEDFCKPLSHCVNVTGHACLALCAVCLALSLLLKLRQVERGRLAVRVE